MALPKPLFPDKEERPDPPVDPLLEAATKLEQTREHVFHLKKALTSFAYTIEDKHRDKKLEERIHARMEAAKLTAELHIAQIERESAKKDWEKTCGEIFGVIAKDPFE